MGVVLESTVRVAAVHELDRIRVVPRARSVGR